MSAEDDILADIPMDQLAALLGVDEATAEQATRQAIPALLGGMQANAEDPAGAMSLTGALGDHPSDLIEGGVDLDQVDPGRPGGRADPTPAADLGADRAGLSVQAAHGAAPRERPGRSTRWRRQRVQQSPE